MRVFIISLHLIFIMACEPPVQNEHTTPSISTGTNPNISSLNDPSFPPLDDYFDCLRKDGGVAIAAHRGGYGARGYPENALETLQHTFTTATQIMEIDVAQSKDGILFLFHDDDLSRLTKARGVVKYEVWDDIKNLQLRDARRNMTRYSPPMLSDVLDWAVSVGAILELDIKRSARYQNVVSAVRKAGAENNIILISYSDNQAAKLADLAPEMMISASVRSVQDIRRLEARGLAREKLIAWTGVDRPNASVWQSLQKQGVESAFGTLGRGTDALDKVYARDGDLSEFIDLADSGAVIISTDIADDVSAILQPQMAIARDCKNRR